MKNLFILFLLGIILSCNSKTKVLSSYDLNILQRILTQHENVGNNDLITLIVYNENIISIKIKPQTIESYEKPYYLAKEVILLKKLQNLEVYKKNISNLPTDSVFYNKVRFSR